MMRCALPLMLAAPALGGCVAGVAAGAAATAINAASQGSARTGVTSGPFLHGLGTDPDWSINLYRSQIVFAGPDGAVTVPTPDMERTETGYRWDSQRLTIVVTRDQCRNPRTGMNDGYRVRVTADGREYRGCGRDLVDTVG